MQVLVDESGGRQSNLICKIRMANSCFYAVSGVGLPGAGLDFGALARRACESSGNLAAKAAQYEKLALPAVRKMFTYDKTFPVLRGKGVVAMSAAIEAGYPVVISVEYNQDRRRRIIPSRLEVRGSDLFGGTGAIIAVGTREAIERYRVANPDTFVAGDAATKVAFLLNLEFTNEQTKPSSQRLVGPPFSILELSSRGHRWLSKGMCDLQ